MQYNLNRKFTLEDQRIDKDDGGGYSTRWVSIGQIWAHMSAAQSSLSFDQEHQDSTQTLELITRNAPIGIPSRPKIGQRLRANSIAYHIIDVAELPQSPLYLKLKARSERFA